MEAEYISLSMGMTMLIPLRTILSEIAICLNFDHNEKSIISTVWEDNEAARKLATTDPPRLTPRSRSIAVKYHWFREHLKKDKIECLGIDTKSQLADLLTKSFAGPEFERLREFLMGW